jgi:hypothetical protein
MCRFLSLTLSHFALEAKCLRTSWTMSWNLRSCLPGFREKGNWEIKVTGWVRGNRSECSQRWWHDAACKGTKSNDRKGNAKHRVGCAKVREMAYHHRGKLCSSITRLSYMRQLNTMQRKARQTRKKWRVRFEFMCRLICSGWWIPIT